MTINYQIFDLKLKRLIQACKETGNFKKLAVVGFISTSNLIDEIALKLGMRPRNREKNKELLFEYMIAVNDIFERNLQIQIFHKETITSIKEIELLFLRNRGNIPYNYIKNLILVYYELRKIEVPNLYKGMTGEDHFDSSNLYMLNIGPRGMIQKKDRSSKFKPILLQKIREQERKVQHNLSKKLDQTSIERAIFLKNIKESLNESKNNRITFQGTLKDNLDFTQVKNVFIKYFLFGLAFLFLCLGGLIVAEMVIYPNIMPVLSNLLLFLFGIVIIIIFSYKRLYKMR
ncbi:MAG: hypothetical protein ACFFFT_19580 [Candidatus Thorarchaeota archaeon]